MTQVADPVIWKLYWYLCRLYVISLCGFSTQASAAMCRQLELRHVVNQYVYDCE
jgi:hypothetical protein